MDNTDLLINAKNLLGMTTRALAAALGLNERTVGNYVLRKYVPTERTMKRVRALLANNEKETTLLYLFRQLSINSQNALITAANALLTAQQIPKS